MYEKILSKLTRKTFFKVKKKCYSDWLGLEEKDKEDIVLLIAFQVVGVDRSCL